ncbi:hypothetical protein [Arthrobacter flavus]|uniref:Uncharacterized protein n=1 Tax=Arthrobacter flavus TaxID=95172 RepID=A0ABW4Q5Y9_9MICC
MSQEALDRHSSVADGFERIKNDLLAETAEVRKVVDQSSVEALAPRRAPRWSRFDIFGAVLQGLIFFAVAGAAFSLLPPNLSHEWQSAIKIVSHRGQISRNAAAHASRTTAWRWQLELIAEPDYVAIFGGREYCLWPDPHQA